MIKEYAGQSENKMQYYEDIVLNIIAKYHKEYYYITREEISKEFSKFFRAQDSDKIKIKMKDLTEIFKRLQQKKVLGWKVNQKDFDGDWIATKWNIILYNYIYYVEKNRKNSKIINWVEFNKFKNVIEKIYPRKEYIDEKIIEKDKIKNFTIKKGNVIKKEGIPFKVERDTIVSGNKANAKIAKLYEYIDNRIRKILESNSNKIFSKKIGDYWCSVIRRPYGIDTDAQVYGDETLIFKNKHIVFQASVDFSKELNNLNSNEDIEKFITNNE